MSSRPTVTRLQLGTQLAHLIGQAPVVDSQMRSLAPRGGHFLRKHRQHAAETAQAVEQLVTLTRFVARLARGALREGWVGALWSRWG